MNLQQTLYVPQSDTGTAEETPCPQWLYVSCEGQSGWIHTDHIS